MNKFYDIATGTVVVWALGSFIIGLVAQENSDVLGKMTEVRAGVATQVSNSTAPDTLAE